MATHSLNPNHPPAGSTKPARKESRRPSTSNTPQTESDSITHTRAGERKWERLTEWVSRR